MDRAGSQPEVTRRVSEYIVDLSFQELPQPVVSQTKIVVLDTVACILAASAPHFQASCIVRDFVKESGGASQASVAGLQERVSAAHAAFANATMAHNVELDDSHPRTGAHIAAAVVPAALAVGEWQRSNGQEFIEALVAAYDVDCRVLLAASPASMYERGFHPSSVCGVFGAVTAAAKILNLDVHKTTNALGLAACQASGLMAWETDLTQMPKSFQMGIAARNGVTAAVLAKGGFSGPPAIFEGRYSPLRAFSDAAAVHPLTEELGSRYEVLLTGLKLYPVCRFLHAALDAFFEIQQQGRLRADDIEQITIRMPHAGVKIVDNNELPSHDAQYVLAVAAVHGQVRVEHIYHDERNDPQIAALMRRIRVLGDSELDIDAQGRFSEPTVVEVRAAGGKGYKVRANAASGDPEKALNWDAIVLKFERMAASLVGSKKATLIEDLIAELDTLDDLSRLGALIRP